MDYKFSIEHRRKIGESVSIARKSIKFSKEHRISLSEALTGRKITDEARKNMSEAHKGLKLSDETKRKIGETNRNTPKLSGENHWNWQGGISIDPYPPEFNEKLKRFILERDGNTCVLCGNFFHPQNAVHHIDYDKENCDPLNLITCCVSCNIKANFDREYWEEYFVELMNVYN